MSLSGTAAESSQTGCFASGGNTEKLPGEKPFTAFLLAVFLYFHCARKLAIFRPKRSTRKLLVFIYRVVSRGAGAGASGPCRRARERVALEPFQLLAKSQSTTTKPAYMQTMHQSFTIITLSGSKALPLPAVPLRSGPSTSTEAPHSPAYRAMAAATFSSYRIFISASAS